MCGRYAFYMPPALLKQKFGIENLLNFPPRYNCAPLQDLPVIVHGRLGYARWGFCPEWGQPADTALAAKMINARSETVAHKPAFRESWARGRKCIVPASGFYEWHRSAGAAKKTPYYIYPEAGPEGGEVIGLAGLWSRVGGRVTFTILTKVADGPIADLHDRMPVILRPGQAQPWFSATPARAQAIIEAASGNDLLYHPVDGDVGKVAIDEPRLVEKLSA